MTQFPLCEEMGLNPLRLDLMHYTDYWLKASDVEKILANGNRQQVYLACEHGPVLGSITKTTENVCDQIILKIPQKPKPVTKAEIIKAIKESHVIDVTSAYCLKDLLARIEKAGIE